MTRCPVVGHRDKLVLVQPLTAMGGESLAFRRCRDSDTSPPPHRDDRVSEVEATAWSPANLYEKRPQHEHSYDPRPIPHHSATDGGEDRHPSFRSVPGGLSNRSMTAQGAGLPRRSRCAPAVPAGPQ